RIPRPAEAQARSGQHDPAPATAQFSKYRCHGCNEPAAYSALDHALRCDACRVKAELEPRGVKHGPGGRGGPGPCDAGCMKCEVESAEPPVPALVDGLSVTDCLYRWWDNRAMVERGGRPTYDLTPDQITAGRAEAQREIARSGHAADLRARIAARAAA